MHFDIIQQCELVFSRNINKLLSWTKLLRQNRKKFPVKKTHSLQFNVARTALGL